jgi:hypothetical protein
MANPNLQFASLDLAASPAIIYSTSSNTTAFIRVTGDFINGENTITNVTDVAGYFGKSTIEVGMSVRSLGEISTIATITNFDPGTNTITLNQPAIASATNQTIFIMPGTGMYYIKNATFSKTGGSVSNPPSNWNAITGSLDANYNPNTLSWGIIGQLAVTGSPSTTLTGLYGQYQLTKIPVRTSTTVVDLILTASNNIPAFTQPSGYVLSTTQTRLFIAQVSGSFMPLAAANDLGINQGLGLAPYNTVVGSTLADFASGSVGAGFPFTGSADITGSLQVTGSVAFETGIGGTDFFIIKSGSANPIKFNGEGIMQFANTNFNPTAIGGGIYYSGSQWFLGVD